MPENMTFVALIHTATVTLDLLVLITLGCGVENLKAGRASFVLDLHVLVALRPTGKRHELVYAYAANRSFVCIWVMISDDELLGRFGLASFQCLMGCERALADKEGVAITLVEMSRRTSVFDEHLRSAKDGTAEACWRRHTVEVFARSAAVESNQGADLWRQRCVRLQVWPQQANTLGRRGRGASCHAHNRQLRGRRGP